MTDTLAPALTFDLHYEGLVAANAEPDEGALDTGEDYDTGSTWALPTLRIHGEDVLRTIAETSKALRDPIEVTVTVDGQQIASGRLWWDTGYGEMGCADGCCGGIVPWEFKVGGSRYGNDAYDVLEHLNRLHGGEHEVRIEGAGYVPPKVDVTFAHHTWKPVKAAPGDRMMLSLDVASKLRYRVTAASRDRIDAAARGAR